MVLQRRRARFLHFDTIYLIKYAGPGGISGEKGGNIMAMKKKTSIMLTARDKKLLELLAKKEPRSQTKELEYLIRRRAEELELKIEEP